MAYRRAYGGRRSSTRSYSGRRSPASRRAPARRTARSRSAGRAGTLRIEVVQASASPIARPMNPAMTAGVIPRKARY